jgi:hypothetical protein
MKRKNIFKEYVECKSEAEARNAWKDLVENGYDKNDIYIARYEGNDGMFHREVFVFK